MRVRACDIPSDSFLSPIGPDLPAGLPFDWRPYVCVAWFDGTAEPGRWVEVGRTYYGDSDAVSRAKEDVSALEALLTPKRLGLAFLPRLRTDFGLVQGVDALVERGDLPVDSVRLTLQPMTPTGRRSKYPARLDFSAYRRTTRGDNGSHGTVWYLQDGSVGKATVDYWRNHVHHHAEFKLMDGEVAVRLLTRCDDPRTGERIELHRA